MLDPVPDCCEKEVHCAPLTPPPPPHAQAAAGASTLEQVHIAYTGTAGRLSVDFVDTAGSGAGPFYVWTSITSNSSGWTRADATTFVAPTIGAMSQGLLDFTGVAPGATAFYMVGSHAQNSTSFAVVPIVTRPEVFAVFGDFGSANDVCMDDLIASAAAGTFDSVLHVGDWVRGVGGVVALLWWRQGSCYESGAFIEGALDTRASLTILPFAPLFPRLTTPPPSPSLFSYRRVSHGMKLWGH